MRVTMNDTILEYVAKSRAECYDYPISSLGEEDQAMRENQENYGELLRLILEGRDQYFDQLPSKQDQFSFTVLHSFLSKKLQVDNVSCDILKTLNLYSDKTGYNHAAELFADENAMPGLDMIEFGESINEIRKRTSYVHQSILAQYQQAIDTFRSCYQYEKITGTDRVTVLPIPETAFREALANALVHRAWDLPANIHIAMFPDRLEITSPGGLPFGIQTEDYFRGYVSILRNPVVAGIFFRLGLIEKFGTGILRIKMVYQGKAVQPTFTITEGSIRVVLPSLDAVPFFTQEEAKILDLVEPGMLFSRQEIAEKAGMSREKTLRLLNRLIDQGVLRKTGQGRATKYSR